MSGRIHCQVQSISISSIFRTQQIGTSFAAFEKVRSALPTASEQKPRASWSNRASGVGGNVNAFAPRFEGKYTHRGFSANHSIAARVDARLITGFGGKAAPPRERLLAGGESDLRGFESWSVAPVGYMSTGGSVRPFDSTGQSIHSFQMRRCFRHTHRSGVIFRMPPPRRRPRPFSAALHCSATGDLCSVSRSGVHSNQMKSRRNTVSCALDAIRRTFGIFRTQGIKTPFSFRRFWSIKRVKT